MNKEQKLNPESKRPKVNKDQLNNFFNYLKKEHGISFSDVINPDGILPSGKNKDFVKN